MPPLKTDFYAEASSRNESWIAFWENLPETFPASEPVPDSTIALMKAWQELRQALFEKISCLSDGAKDLP